MDGQDGCFFAGSPEYRVYAVVVFSTVRALIRECPNYGIHYTCPNGIAAFIYRGEILNPAKGLLMPLRAL